MIDQIGGRKTLAAALIVVIGLVIVFFKGDVPSNMLQLLQVTFGAFVFGNGVEHISGAWTNRSTSEVDLSSVTEEITTVRKHAEEMKAAIATTQQAVATTQQGVGALVQIVSRATGQAPQPVSNR